MKQINKKILLGALIVLFALFIGSLTPRDSRFEDVKVTFVYSEEDTKVESFTILNKWDLEEQIADYVDNTKIPVAIIHNYK